MPGPRDKSDSNFTLLTFTTSVMYIFDRREVPRTDFIYSTLLLPGKNDYVCSVLYETWNHTYVAIRWSVFSFPVSRERQCVCMCIEGDVSGIILLTQGLQ